MTLILDNLPENIERALRERAMAECKSLDRAAIDAMARGLGVTTCGQTEATQLRDLSDLIGSGGIDDEIEAFFWEQRHIDPDIWK